MDIDAERAYAALRSRDPRFDGWVFAAVTSTGIYCRPSCPAVTPRREHVRFVPTAAAAQAAGFRACKRCRPDASPGSPEWDRRADLVGRAMRLILDGVVDRQGVTGLAAQLGYSARHVHRELVTEVGAGPLALARAQRAATARTLIETTDLPLTHVAFAAGFSSVRQFNGTVREVFAASPSQLRQRRRGRGPAAADRISLRLACRRPAQLRRVLEHLGRRAVSGIEEALPDGGFRRSVALPNGAAVIDLHVDAESGVRALLRLEDLRDLSTAVRRCRRLLDLDADPQAVDAHLAADPRLRPLVEARPGLRVAGSMDPAETALRVVLGQQVSLAAGATLSARLAEHLGPPLGAPVGAVNRCWPLVELVAAATPEVIPGMPSARGRALVRLASSIATGAVDLGAGADRDRTRQALAELPGIGPWTVEMIALRSLGDPDAFPASDLVLRRSAERHGMPGRPTPLERTSGAWAPWRAYAAEHLWASALDAPAVAA